ncbi:MAG TPA: response regulator [Candidatus Krumholzibacteria bacterium]|nr:response regulator [Candidatus Krumholzibacteria bacterium]
MPEARPVIHVVDDDDSFRRAVGRWLRAAGFAVRPYASAAEFFQGRVAGTPGCVLADMRMPGMSGLDLQAALAKTPDPLPVVFLSAYGDVPTTVRAMKHGAEDFLTKHASREDLLAAVRRALERDARERADRAHRQSLRGRLASLTQREREVLALVVQGKLNKEIAAELGIHERTVKFHRTAITTKLEVQSVAQLTRLVQEAGILP